MSTNSIWNSQEALKTITKTKHKLTSLSVYVRSAQFSYLQKILKPTQSDKIIDIGATSNETLADSNLFVKLYPYKKKLTLATIENASTLRKLYPNTNVVKIFPNRALPYKDKQFEIATSWATLEHVGTKGKQMFFLKEIDRVARKVYITTPYKYCIYEPHTELFFLHWLPDTWFRKILKLFGKHFWSYENNLRSLSISDVRKILPNSNYKITVYKMFNFLPSHLIIYKV